MHYSQNYEKRWCQPCSQTPSPSCLCTLLSFWSSSSSSLPNPNSLLPHIIRMHSLFPLSQSDSISVTCKQRRGLSLLVAQPTGLSSIFRAHGSACTIVAGYVFTLMASLSLFFFFSIPSHAKVFMMESKSPSPPFSFLVYLLRKPVISFINMHILRIAKTSIFIDPHPFYKIVSCYIQCSASCFFKLNF